MNYTPLSIPERITEQCWPEGIKPVVSVVCIAFQHQEYIRQCIDGFLIQETTFPVEIIVHDDASPDQTPDIIREYESKYPNLIRSIIQTENQYSKQSGFFSHLLQQCRGQYIALCEGDDYWTHKSKLAIQAAYLNEYSAVSLVYTNRMIITSEGMKPDISKFLALRQAEVLTGLMPTIQTAMFRNFDTVSRLLYRHRTLYGADWFIGYACSIFGELHRITDVTACYRDSGSGIWSGLDPAEKATISIRNMESYHRALQIYPNSFYNEFIIRQAVGAIGYKISGQFVRKTNWHVLGLCHQAFPGRRMVFWMTVGSRVIRRATAKLFKNASAVDDDQI